MREWDNLFSLAEHPNIMRLELTFQDSQSLFFLTEFCENGDLKSLIKKNEKLSFEVT